MKVGGNESATKFFQSNGGTAALNSKDPKTKYTSSAATKYKEELKRRAARDAQEYPEDVVITDAAGGLDGTSTPAGEPEDDFFSSWDKPAIKRPTPPASRTATPPVISRTASPFLNANKNGNGINRAPSPLSGDASADKPAPAPAASRTVHSSALRKSAVGSGPRKTSVLGAKKTKLGAKKLTGDVIDFDAAEKKAKEEAERIEKLGYDPEAEEPQAPAAKAAAATSSSSASTTAPTGTYGNPAPRAGAKDADVQRLGMGVARLGFGQIGGAKKPAAEAKKMGGFGSVGPIKAKEEGMSLSAPLPTSLQSLTEVTDDSERYARQKFGAQKGISSDEFFGKGAFDPNAQTEAKQRLQGFEGASAISSNAYFGREEADEPEDYGDLEGEVKDFIRKFGTSASDDLENLQALAGEGARRLQGALRAYMNS